MDDFDMLEISVQASFFTKIKNGDVKAVGDFIDGNSEIPPFNNENGESAAAVALQSKQLAVYEALVSRGWILDSNEDFYKIVDNLKNILATELKEIELKGIQNPNDLTSLIDNFLDQNRYISPNSYEERKSKWDKIFLLSEGKINIIANVFDKALKCELREINKRHFIKNPYEKHLTSLITRTAIYFGGKSATTNRPKHLKAIAEAYEELNEVPEIRAIIKVVANVNDLKVIFDFDHDTVEYADPAGGSPHTEGLAYYKTGVVYIGAKALYETNQNDPQGSDTAFHSIEGTHMRQNLTASNANDGKVTRSDVLGVIAHEFCHVAMFRIYINQCKPYRKNSEVEIEFKRVVNHCEQGVKDLEVWINTLENSAKNMNIKKYIEKYVCYVFWCYKKHLWHTELIVRVPHMLAAYQGNDEKIKSLKETFKKLFDFFAKTTLPDLEKEIDLMSAVWKLKSKEPQQLTESKIFILQELKLSIWKLKPQKLTESRTFKISLETNNLNEILEIHSNCPRMTMNWSLGIFQEMISKPDFIFLELFHLKDEETYALMVDAHSSCMKPRIVIDCDNEMKQQIGKIAEKMKIDKIKERIIFIHNYEEPIMEDAAHFEISHSWLDLEEKSKENLVERMINFQGKKILLKEIVDHLSDAVDLVPLKELLDNYLKIGIELKFPDIDFHIKREFQNNKSNKIETTQLLNDAVKSKVILLSDDPGIGKTTELKMLALDFNKKFRSFWVAFVDLKEHFEAYEKDENFKTEFISAGAVATFFAKKIFKLTDFEKEVFRNLFCSNRVVLILDGFDEISPSFKKFVTMLIKSIRKRSDNILVTSTRPHLKDELCTELEVEAYKLMPLTWEKCGEIFEKSFEKNGFTGEILKKKINEASDFLKNLTQNSDPVNNPLMLRMIAQVFTEGQFSQDMRPNTFSIYEKFTDIMIKKSMTKGEDSKQEGAKNYKSKFNIFTFYQKEAFEVIFQYENDHEIKEFFYSCFSDVQPLPVEEITRIGLLKSDGSGKLHFIHRTFAEFFVAEFLIKNIFDLKALNNQEERVLLNEDRLNSIYKIFRKVFSYNRNFITVRSFIDGAFENFPCVKSVKKKNLISTYNNIFQNDELPKYFQYLVQESLLNIITIITRCADNDELKRLWIDKKYKVGKNESESNIFMWAARKGSLYFNTKLTALADDVLDRKDFENFFTEKDASGETVVSIAYQNQKDVFEFYLQKDFPLPYVGFSDTKLIVEIKFKLNKFLENADISGFREELEKIEEEQGVEYLRKLWKTQINLGKPIFFKTCYLSSSVADLEKLWNFLRNILDENDFKSILKKPNRDMMTPLMFKAKYGKTEVFISFWELLNKFLTPEEKENILNDKDKFGNNLFNNAMKNEDPENFLAIKDLYGITFGEDKVTRLTKEFNKSRSFFTNIQNGDVKGVGDFIDKNKEIAPFDNEYGESAAAVALKSKQLAVYEVLVSRGWILGSNEDFYEIVNNLKNILTKELFEIEQKCLQNPNDLTSLIDTFLERNRYISPNNYEKEKSSLAIKYKQLVSDKDNSKIINEFESALKSELRQIHERNFLKNPYEKHLTSLITRTSIYFGGNSATSNRRNYLNLIARAYEELNEVLEIRAIFEVVANVKDLKVIFDFDRDSIEHVAGNPNVQEGTNAEKVEVYIGAKALNQANRSEVLGALARELCHVALFYIYNNENKPYHKGDSIGGQESISALDDCRENSGKESCIGVVFSCPEKFRHNELIVRVPYLLALYQGDKVKIESLKETFKKLFDYFETKILPDIEKENELMSSLWKLKSKEPKHLIDSKIWIKQKMLEFDLDSKKNLEISSNCPQMTMSWIFPEMMSKSNDNFLFLALNHLKDDMYELVMNAHSSCMRPRIVIDCDNETKQEIVKIAEKMKWDKITARIIFIHNQEESVMGCASHFKVSHSWLDLEEKSKENLIKTIIRFQGEKVLFEEIVNRNSAALNFVPLKELLDNYLKIGKKLEFPEVDIHVKRKYLINSSEEIEGSQLLNIAENSKIILLSDDPGIGKTTELKMLAIEFKKKFKSFWVAFVDLKEHLEFYERDQNFKANFNSSEEIANFFAQKIFKLNEFETKVFNHLFSTDRVVLLFDGFDEISPSFNKFVTMMIKSIRKHSRNILVTSTRPHLREELCEELEVEAYTLMTLTEKNCNEILELSFQKNRIEGDDLKRRLYQARDFFQRLNMNSEPVKNSLIIRMVAQFFSSNQFDEDKQPNIFSIYEIIVKILIKKSMIKGNDARQEAASFLISDFNIITFYEKEAFKYVFKKGFNNFFDLCFCDVQSPPDEQIKRIGLMKSDGSGMFQFIHRTFAEFFVAGFIFKNVFDLNALIGRKNKDPINNSKKKRLIEEIYGIIREVFTLDQNHYKLVRSFIDGAFESLIVNFDMVEKEVLLETFYELFTKDKLPEYFQCFEKEKLNNLSTIIKLCEE